jgi:glycosyltransferase involved in cell wall biosynthesis
MTPLVDVSVVIPHRNHVRFLREAACSVLDQVEVTVELIVVDDGSSDDPKPVLDTLDSSKIRLIRQNHGGPASARNAGAQQAKGTYLAFLDADDFWERDRLTRALGALQALISPAMSFARMQEFLDPQLDLRNLSPPRVRTLSGISASGLVINRRDFHHVGLFDTSLKTGEFIHWYLRATNLGLQEILDDRVLVHRRIHAANRDRHRREYNQDYARILLRNLKERHTWS